MNINHVRDLGELIRRARKEAGLRQADCADLCGVSTPFLSALENGKPTVQMALVLRVCQALGITVCAEVPDPDRNSRG